jgi:hypothetical protein
MVALADVEPPLWLGAAFVDGERGGHERGLRHVIAKCPFSSQL